LICDSCQTSTASDEQPFPDPLGISEYRPMITPDCSFFSLVHTEETLTIPILEAVNKCCFFQSNPRLLVSPYRVESPVCLFIFPESISPLEGDVIKIRDANLTEFHWLSEEFGLTEFQPKFPSYVPRWTSQKEKQKSRFGSTRMNCGASGKDKAILSRQGDVGGQDHSALHRF
jgi:hypothetical protein